MYIIRMLVPFLFNRLIPEILLTFRCPKSIPVLQVFIIFVCYVHIFIFMYTFLYLLCTHMFVYLSLHNNQISESSKLVAQVKL